MKYLRYIEQVKFHKEEYNVESHQTDDSAGKNEGQV